MTIWGTQFHVERRGRMVRTSDSQPDGRGFESRRRHAVVSEQDTLKSTARGSQNKQNCLRHVPLTSVKYHQWVVRAYLRSKIGSIALTLKCDASDTLRYSKCWFNTCTYKCTYKVKWVQNWRFQVWSKHFECLQVNTLKCSHSQCTGSVTLQLLEWVQLEQFDNGGRVLWFFVLKSVKMG
jgi:hypothetical protein